MIYNQTTVDILNKWFYEHRSHPYASYQQKTELSVLTSLTHEQVSRWLINERQKQKITKDNMINL